MPKRYRIGDVAKLIGITSESIRYYESRGLIAPVRDSQSGYRYYGTWDIHMLKRARVLRQFGFTLEESASILSQKKDEDVAEFMREKEQEIQQEIERKMLLLRRIRESNAQLQDAIDSIGKFRLENRPAFLRLHMQTGYMLDQNEEVQELMQEWMNEAPFLSSSALFTLEDYYDNNSDFSFGLIMEEKYAGILGDRQSEFVKHYPEVPCIYTAFQSRDTKYLNPSYLKEAMNYIFRNGLQPVGEILTRVVVMRKPENEYFNCHQVWIPIC